MLSFIIIYSFYFTVVEITILATQEELLSYVNLSQGGSEDILRGCPTPLSGSNFHFSAPPNWSYILKRENGRSTAHLSSHTTSVGKGEETVIVWKVSRGVCWLIPQERFHAQKWGSRLQASGQIWSTFTPQDIRSVLGELSVSPLPSPHPKGALRLLSSLHPQLPPQSQARVCQMKQQRALKKTDLTEKGVW